MAAGMQKREPLRDAVWKRALEEDAPQGPASTVGDIPAS